MKPRKKVEDKEICLALNAPVGRINPDFREAMKHSASAKQPPAITRSQARRQRRKKLRTHYLADLADNNPELFAKKWNWLLEGWVREVARRAPLLREKDGNWTLTAAALIADVKDMLQSIGNRATAAEMGATLATLNETQMQAMARAVEKRLAPKQWGTPIGFRPDTSA